MRILFVIDSLGHMGGAEKVLTMLANYFVSKEIDVRILTLKASGILFDVNDNIKVIGSEEIKKKGFMFDKFTMFVKQIWSINKVIRQENPDIVISFISAANILSIIASKIAKVPIVISEHSSYHRGVSGRFWKILRRLTYPFADKAIILTNEDKPKYHYVKDVSIIRNPLILENNHLNIERQKIILGVGRLEKVKGFDMLIKAFSKIDNEGWKLLIAGEGSERNTLQNMVDNLNISDKVQLLGLKNNMELYYRKSSIYVLSSRSEGFPGGLCEALGYGCACIAFDCPTGPKEIISDGVNGVLVEKNSVDMLSYEMEKMMKNDSIRTRFSKEAVAISEKLDIEIIGDTWLSVFNNIVKR